MNHTTNYQLNQWEASDKVQRVDFNADNAKIDAALAAETQAREALAATVPKIVSGTYTGSGAASRFISLPFTPKAVYVCTEGGLAYSPNVSGYIFGGLALEGAPSVHDYQNQKHTAVAISGSGFAVYEKTIDSYSAVHANMSGTVYHYIAFTW